jgi:hypothetical protein
LSYFFGFSVFYFVTATAIGAIAIAPTSAAFRNNENLAAVRRYFESFLTFEKETVSRYAPLPKTASKGAATKPMQLSQLVCVNEDPASPLILVTHKIYEFPCRTPVEISFCFEVQVPVAFFALHLEISAHMNPSNFSVRQHTSYFPRCPHD